MKLPDKIYVEPDVDRKGVVAWIDDELQAFAGVLERNKMTLYIPASEAEALRDRVKELEVRELQLHGLLGEAAGYIKGQTEWHFHAMGKLYLAKEHLENNGLLKRIGEAIGGHPNGR